MPKPSTLQLQILDRLFHSLHERNIAAVSSAPAANLFLTLPAADNRMQIRSFGEAILRSAAAVEQTFGGIMTRLWDDPFEWTLPEELSTAEKIKEYIWEVEKTRVKGFAFLISDDELLKQIPAPECIKPIFEILIETLARAENLHGRANAIRELL